MLFDDKLMMIQFRIGAGDAGDANGRFFFGKFS